MESSSASLTSCSDITTLALSPLLEGQCCRSCTAAASGRSRQQWSRAVAWSGPSTTTSTSSRIVSASTSGRSWTTWSQSARTLMGRGKHLFCVNVKSLFITYSFMLVHNTKAPSSIARGRTNIYCSKSKNTTRPTTFSPTFSHRL